jgi:Flp pilus assembly protein TadD/SAM-dependent methyltransferase
MTNGRDRYPDGYPGSFANSLPDQLYRQGAQSHQAGDLTAAESRYRELLQIAPKHVNGLYSLGVIGLQTGRSELAADMIGRAVALHDKEPDWHFNLGYAYGQLGRASDSVRHLRRAIAINPNHVNALCHLGLAAMQAGRTNEAMAEFQRALTIDPSHIPSLNGLGNVHASRGELAQAADVFETIINTRPNPVAYENLALVHLTRGEPWKALPILQDGMRQSATPKMQQLFVACVPFLRATQNDPGLQELAVRALSEGWCAPGWIAQFAASLLKVRPEIAAVMERAADAWPSRLPAEELFGGSGLAAMAGNPLLLALLEATPIADVAFERFLTATRVALLQLADTADTAIDPDALRLLTAMARHCFLNEYVFAVTAEEQARARAVGERLETALRSGASPLAHRVAAAASYGPLHALRGAHALLERDWPEPFADLVTQQVREPFEEQAARSQIVQLTSIEDPISQQVRARYEENPYPRWTRIVPATPRPSLDEHVRAKFPQAPFNSLGRGGNIDILMAGSGTGPAIGDMTQQFPLSRILAIDLSLASLAYARRMTRAAGIANVEYAQADILQIATIGRSFDLIECRGVLHHLDDPLAGWRALLSVLRPNGIMAVALYSKFARHSLEPARQWIAARGYRPVADDIRQFRQDVMDHEDRAQFESVLDSSDFYTASSCRDLLFHSREHCFTLPQIDDFLKSNRLRLLGLELPPALAHRYAARYPQDRLMTNLKFWNEFEQDHPEIFGGMYHFWLQCDG